MQSSVELPPIQNHINRQPVSPFHSPRPRELLPSIMTSSPPGRSSTLPPLQRTHSLQKTAKPARPRKSSITQNNSKPKHERTKSKDHVRRLSIEGRKAFSAEPPTLAAVGKRWEDLIEAATSANEADSDRDLTPVWPHSRDMVYMKLNLPPRSPNLPRPPNAPRSRHSPRSTTATQNRTRPPPSKTP